MGMPRVLSMPIVPQYRYGHTVPCHVPYFRKAPPRLLREGRDPHDLDDGQLANNPYTRSKKSLRRLEFRIVGGGGMTRAEMPGADAPATTPAAGRRQRAAAICASEP